VKSTNTDNLPNLLVSDGHGQVFEVPKLKMVGMSLNLPCLPDESELIPMPYGSQLYELPERIPVGYDPIREEFVELAEYNGHPVTAVATFMAPAYTQILRAAYRKRNTAPMLPLFSFTAVGWRNNGFWVAGVRIDEDIRQDPAQFNDNLVEQRAQETLNRFPHNRLVDHLVNNCARCYRCPAAQNFVLGRWECPVPISPACNAHCLGCISYQPADEVVASQDRLDFIPTVEEIVEFTVPHLETAPRAIISFGQGCEGEPLMQAKLLEESIREIRRRTDKGTINLNTNASYPTVIEKLCLAGLDSIRVSLNSAQPDLYTNYFLPNDYDFDDVVQSMKVMNRHRRWVSLNYFIFPGFSDDSQEMVNLNRLLHTVQMDFIQMRNLNIDPEWYISELGLLKHCSNPVGVLRWMESFKKEFPELRFGYFNPPKEDW
jgi:pyruvate-formate lyase-activating enzyme